MSKEFRIKRLYRKSTGWCWWFQIGEWFDVLTAYAGATGDVRRRFKVEYESPYRTQEEAQRQLEYWSTR